MNLLKKLSHEFKNELEQLDTTIKNVLAHNINLIQDILMHTVCGSGKRLRPLLLIAAANLKSGNKSESIIQTAAAIELIHTATLLHDDVVDENHLRRGQATPNHIWGNAYTILTGDYLFTKAFQLLIEQKNIEILEISSSTAMQIAEGEILQMMNMGNLKIDLETNIQIIQAKTAKLISASCQIGAIIAGYSQEEQILLAEYGKNLGLLFQISDDILDYMGDPLLTGKPIGTDFWEGKITLPLLYALNNAPEKECIYIQEIMGSKNKDDFIKVQNFIIKNHGISSTLEFSKKIQETALEHLSCFPDTPTKNLLQDLARNCLTRET